MMKKISLIKITTAAFLSGCIFLSACENDEKVVNSLNKKITGIEEAKQVVINYTLGGKTKSVLTSPLMLNVNDTVPYVEFPNTLHADFYNEEGVIESVLTARYAKYKQNQSIVFLRDSVKVINIQKGDTLYCNELYWDRNRRGTEFYTDKPVKIRTKTNIINGEGGMESSQDFKNWHIMETRNSTIKIPASKFPG
ncbi:MAG: LPS export ABC transporter periplasmic protein LptC [Ferruginibacter sp.]